MYSNIRLLDCINRPEALINKAIELGLSGICITDHESLSAHVDVLKYADKIYKDHPDFTIALGNEIYLTDTREKGQKYYHFILIAKDAIGHKALRELSSTAWYYSYVDRGLERVPTLKSELAEVINKYKGHVIATTACIGGELSSNALMMYNCAAIGDNRTAEMYEQKMISFLKYCTDLFGDDFYIECAPSTNADQICTNYTLWKIIQKHNYNIKMVVGTDSHYLTKEDRWIHKSFLNSKGGEREVDAFYEFTYLMDYQECWGLIRDGFFQFQDVKDPDEVASWILDNTNDIKDKVQRYSLFHPQSIPTVEIKEYKSVQVDNTFLKQYNNIEWNYPNLTELLQSDNKYNKYWVNECLNKLQEIGKCNKIYLDELEEEARVKKTIGEQLNTNMFCYPITLQHYIDMIWDCGSIVGAGRGSSCAALNHYLLGVTQLDPIEWKLPFFRYMNDKRTELGCLILILPSCKKRM